MIVNKKYKVSWKHNNESAKNYLSDKEIVDSVVEIIDKAPNREKSKENIFLLYQSQERSNRSYSKCFIEDLESGDLYEGIGVVHPNDSFNRKVGLYVSFKDAVSKIDNKVTRTELWDVYFATGHKKYKAI